MSDPVNYYKVLGPDRMPHHGGSGQWPPPGEWLRVEGGIIPCENGLHVCTREQLIKWIGPEIWEVQVDRRSHVVDAGDKTVVRRARLLRRLDTWNDRTVRLFAADCAERVLPLTDNDPRCVNVIAVARRFANGHATAVELSAAGAAARAAARASAGASAWDAARDAAEDAARAAAGDAAGAAAWASAGDAERAWQTERLWWYLDGAR